jgi:hypothetical protein
VTHQQLRAIGLSPAAIKHRVRTGWLFPVYRGVYAVGRPPVTNLERASAAVLACGPRAALSHGSAMSLWGLNRHWSPPFEVVVPTVRRHPGIRTHRSKTLHRRDLTIQLGIRTTTPARTILDMAKRLNDKRLTRAVNDAIHSRFMFESDLLQASHRHPNAARVAPFIADLAHGLTQSEIEDRFKRLCKTHGLPTPLTNVDVIGYRVDALFPDHRVIVELDSFEFHRDRATFESDRDRDADTLLAGYITIRVTDERMKADPQREADRLKAILDARARTAKPQRGR